MSSFPFTASNGGINSQGTVRSYQIFAKKKKKSQGRFSPFGPSDMLLLLPVVVFASTVLWNLSVWSDVYFK